MLMAHQIDIMESCYSESSFRATCEMNHRPTVLGCPVCWPVMANPFWLTVSFNEQPVTIIWTLQREMCNMLGSLVEYCLTGPTSFQRPPWAPHPSLRGVRGEQEAGVTIIEKREDDGPAPWGGVVAHSHEKMFIRLWCDVEAFYSAVVYLCIVVFVF